MLARRPSPLGKRHPGELLRADFHACPMQTTELLADRRASRFAVVHRAVTASVWAALAIAVFLTMRRMSGAFTAPLPFPQVVGAAVAITIWSLGVIAFNARRTTPDIQPLGRAPRWPTPMAIGGNTNSYAVVISFVGPIVALVLFAFACSFRNDRFADWLIWVPAIAISACATRFAPWLVSAPLAVQGLPSTETRQVADAHDRLTQRIVRVRTADGSERIEATLIAEFPPDERLAILHIGFCPPFEHLPEIEAIATDGPDAEVKIAQILHNGAQLEVRLQQPSVAPEQVSLELIAQSV